MSPLNTPPIPIVLCPGMHPPTWTEAFLNTLQATLPYHRPIYVVPTHGHLAISGAHIFDFILTRLQLSPHQIHKHHNPLTLISFSAGVVGAAQFAWIWQQLGGHLQGFFALDGWGVPLPGDWPLYRLSHDYFTDWSSAMLGVGCDRFFADPAVSHTSLWQRPHQTTGWWLHQSVTGQISQTQTTATDFILRFI